jgi:hypothetical protein
MSSNEEEWNLANGQSSRSTFSLPRFLEYTEKSIEERFQPISQSSLDFLSTVPAIFMSELQFDRTDGKTEYVTVQIGRVFDLIVSKNEILYSYRIDSNFGRFNISNRAAFESAFGMGRMELHRTHWAIKSSELQNALVSAGVTPFVPAPPPPPPPHIPPPPIPPVPELPPVDTLQAFLDRIMDLETASDDEIFYRGHSDVKYELIPTLFRKHDNGEFRWLPKEDIITRELLTAQAREFAEDRSMLDHLVRMQHYGLPTRLLDVTSNPLIALYFSCSAMKRDSLGNEIVGEVIVLKTKTSDVSFFDSDKVSCIANLCLLNHGQKNQLDTQLSVEDFKMTDGGQRLLDLIRREKPHFQDKIVPSDLTKIIFVRSRITHERINSQSGAFLLFGKDAVLPETGHSDLDIKRIKILNKAGILKDLAKLNIKASTVYPGIEKTAADIAKAHELPMTPAGL